MIIKKIDGHGPEQYYGPPMVGGHERAPVMIMGGPGLPPPMILDFIMKAMNDMPMQNGGDIPVMVGNGTQMLAPKISGPISAPVIRQILDKAAKGRPVELSEHLI